jgi:hypothetical protein
MEKRWYIKKNYEATESNKNFEGERMFFCSGIREIFLSQDELPNYSQICTYGYKALSGAKKALNEAEWLAKLEEDRGHWIVNVELVEVKI